MAVATAALVMASGSAGVGSAAAAESLRMQALLNPDGSGFLGVNTPREPMTWEACTPALSNCVPFGSGGKINTTGASPGTVFRVSGSNESTGLSPIWHGNVVSLTAPSVSGPVRANELVKPRSGQWQGGWEGEGDFFQLAACRTVQGTKCTTLTDSHYPGSCSESSSVLDPAFIGDYLRVADQRRGSGPHIVLKYASGSPYAARGGVWEVSAVTSAAVVGRIGAPKGPRTDQCGFPPLNDASISERGIVSVQCGLGCRAVLIAKRNRRTARVVRKLSRWQTLRQPTKLQLSRQSRALLGSGRARIVVKIDGRRAAQRAVVLRTESKRLLY